MSQTNEKLLTLIRRSPSPFHAVEQLRQRLLAEGYRELREREPWQLAPGGRYLVTRGGTALMAFRVPAGDWRGFLLTASHCDSPTFRVKGTAAGPENYLRLSVEPYGGMIMSSWLDRPLTLAGRGIFRRRGGVESRLIYVDRDLLVIPSVAIHMNREANKHASFDPKADVVPLLGLGEDRDALARLAAESAGAKREDLLALELSLCPREPGFVGGAAGELVVSPRLDDLQCVYGCLEGFLQTREGGNLPVYCVLDHEEVGSATRQGADGTLLREVLERICAALGRRLPEETADSMLLSADNAHAVHPNHPEYADSGHRPRLNGGVVIKHNANRRYATDAMAAALAEEICRRSGVPVQHYSNRPDLPGGSTLGSIANTHFSVLTADVGLAQLAMHAACETAGAEDTDHLIRAAAAFYGATLRQGEDGGYDLA